MAGKKILYLSHSDRFDGGSERSYLATLKALKHLGYSLVGVFPGQGSLMEACSPYLDSTYVSKLRKWTNYGPEEMGGISGYARYWAGNQYRIFQGLKEVVQIARQEKPDLIMSQTLTIPQGALAAKKLSVPHIWNLREFGDLDHGFWFDYGKTWTFNLLGKWSEKVICNSEAVKRHFNNYIKEDKLEVVYTAMELKDACLDKKDRLAYFSIVGRLSPSKGQELAIRAIHILKERGHTIGLKIIGQSNTYKSQLMGIAAQLGVESLVEFCGHQEQPQAISRKGLGQLVCSKAEAFGRVTVEAMLEGVPVISANTGAGPELVGKSKRGLLFDYPNVESLAKCMLEIMENYPEATRRATSAQEWAISKFSKESFSRRLEEVIHPILQKP